MTSASPCRLETVESLHTSQVKPTCENVLVSSYSSEACLAEYVFLSCFSGTYASGTFSMAAGMIWVVRAVANLVLDDVVQFEHRGRFAVWLMVGLQAVPWRRASSWHVGGLRLEEMGSLSTVSGCLALLSWRK